MDEFNFRRRRVPAFGSWDCDGNLPFTQCFESAREAGLLRCSYSGEDRDLYVAGDLYENDVVTPAVIVVPRHRAKVGYSKEKQRRKDDDDEWVMWNCDGEFKEPPSPVSASVALPPPPAAAKPVDQDLYTISPDLLRANTKRKRGWGVFSSCLRPVCLR
ncbi:uncharacterized protein LOC127252187 [Andrographis paniculata]|uniref:uncharacterized protein LOC127252187 n=1 Tax=Andrographis paniculata TaxID=175694 RepID=UPI0021E89C31|nr:uncharacterized protein LOC127252187 [Andrographis paniculata]